MWAKTTGNETDGSRERSPLAADLLGYRPGVLVERAGALERLAGNEALLNRISARFRAEAPRTMEQLRQLLAEDDLRAAGIRAHSLKSAAATVGALAVSRAAEQLERACENGSGGPHWQLMEQLDTAWQRTLPHL